MDSRWMATCPLADVLPLKKIRLAFFPFSYSPLLWQFCHGCRASYVAGFGFGNPHCWLALQDISGHHKHSSFHQDRRRSLSNVWDQCSISRPPDSRPQLLGCLGVDKLLSIDKSVVIIYHALYSWIVLLPVLVYNREKNRSLLLPELVMAEHDTVSDVVESNVQFASKILTPNRMD